MLTLVFGRTPFFGFLQTIGYFPPLTMAGLTMIPPPGGFKATGCTIAVGTGDDDDDVEDIDDKADNFLGNFGGAVMPEIPETTESLVLNEPVLEADESPRFSVPNSPSKSGCSAFLASLARTSASYPCK